jgi:hypothetical protein
MPGRVIFIVSLTRAGLLSFSLTNPFSSINLMDALLSSTTAYYSHGILARARVPIRSRSAYFYETKRTSRGASSWIDPSISKISVLSCSFLGEGHG